MIYILYLFLEWRIGGYLEIYAVFVLVQCTSGCSRTCDAIVHSLGRYPTAVEMSDAVVHRESLSQGSSNPIPSLSGDSRDEHPLRS